MALIAALVTKYTNRRGKWLHARRSLEMDPPPVSIPWAQRALDEQLVDIKLRRAIVVPNTKIAFLARLAFGDGDYRVFYEDKAAALQWLSEEH